MSSGQKACWEDAKEEAFRDHVRRLKVLGFVAIADTVTNIADSLRRLEHGMPSLTRSEWACIDHVKNELKKLL